MNGEARAAGEPGGSRLVLARRLLAVVSLLGLGALVGTLAMPGPGGPPMPRLGRSTFTAGLLLVPLMIGVIGLVANLYWSRWLGVAVGLAVLPWAGVVTFAKIGGLSVVGGAIALACAVLLLVALTGGSMITSFEGRTPDAVWTGPRMRLLRWTVIGNLVTVLTLYLMGVAYRFYIAWQLAFLAATLIGLIAGIVLLARQKTAGLLLVWLCCVLLVPAGALFVRAEAGSTGEALLLIAAFLPGLLTGWATVFVFGKPVWRYLRS